jgi:hypothetical protein
VRCGSAFTPDQAARRGESFRIGSIVELSLVEVDEAGPRVLHDEVIEAGTDELLRYFDVAQYVGATGGKVMKAFPDGSNAAVGAIEHTGSSVPPEPQAQLPGSDDARSAAIRCRF